MQRNYTCDGAALLRYQAEKDARPGIFFCTHPAQADIHR